MRALLVLCVLALPAWGQSALVRGQNARKAAAKSGPIAVPEDERDCFVPEGATCAEGFKLCFDGDAEASCSGYSRETVTLRVEYANEPVSKATARGMPLRFEGGYEPEGSTECDTFAIGFSRPKTGGLTPEQRAEAEKKAREEEKRLEAIEREKCRAKERSKADKDRKWQRCALLSVDACRREAFLDCQGNTKQRGLVRASWSKPKDKPANDTLKLEVLGR